MIEVIENHPKTPPSPQSPEVIEVIEKEPTPPPAPAVPPKVEELQESPITSVQKDNSKENMAKYINERAKLEKMLPEGYPASFLNLSPKDQDRISSQLQITLQYYLKIKEEDKKKVPYMFVPPPSPELYYEKDGAIIKKEGN
ncbi:hypothetical protein [Zunongwangia sp. HRR-M8]|uniref:hypothetical protein n=1 Tax=Zunongwangia sp. HRR-M8 TaxID=3015170 RepID=UPI0022DE2F59|nr:hypothetical protein [Zunongwangia sp. HRR-M8]WBL23694.1 hypothetical protein PBT89_06980 [Zunongwangia sp. HRR-M8]